MCALCSQIPNAPTCIDARVNPELSFNEAGDVGGTTATAQALALGDEAFGSVGVAADLDVYAVNVVSGQSYLINLVNDTVSGLGLSDTLLHLYNSSGTLIGTDDDGGFGLTSYLFYTATYTGTLYVEAGGYSTSTGDYILSVYQNDIPESTATPAFLQAGSSVTGYTDLSASYDEDWYATTLTGGTSYTISMSNLAGTYGVGFVEIFSSAGTLIASNAGSLVFTPTTTGTYYVSAGPQTTSGYGTYSVNIAVGGSGGGSWEAPNLAEPLASIDWGFTVPDNTPATATTNINVFFAASGVTVTDGNSDSPTFLTTGWNAAEMAAAQTAFQNFANVSNVTFTYVNNIASADFVMFESGNATTALGYWGVGGGSVTYGGTAYNLDGWGVFNSTDASWTTPGLAVGGYGYITLIHEIGHGMGLAHPHDNGGTSSVMAGVTSAFGDYGDLNLNQGIWTTMTYNDGWHSVNGAMPTTQGYGWQGSLMALDIAVLQDNYGTVVRNAGANTYTLPTANTAGTYYQSLWDTGGIDTIINPGSGTALIDLNAAPLNNTANAGGYVSYVNGIRGGFTIANGVAIENATGGGGIDTIYGNSIANLLIGNGGNDVLNGLGGADTMRGGLGDDRYYVDNASDVTDETTGGGGTFDLVLAFVDFTAALGIERVQLSGSANLNAYGRAGQADNLYGNTGNNVLSGNTGNDYMRGGLGNDTYYVHDAGDVTDEVNGGGGGANDIVLSYVTYSALSGIERLTLLGTSVINGVGRNLQNDIITGNSAANVLNGLSGNDTLDGGLGIDSLIGGVGLDIFKFTTAAAAANLDYVIDYSVADDTIQIDNAVFALLGGAGALVASLFKNLALGAQDANDVLVYNQTTGALFYDNNGLTAGGQFQIADFTNGLVLTSTEFTVI